MNCRWREELILLHAHGQLRGWERLRTELHLRGCEHCRTAWGRFSVERESLRRAITRTTGAQSWEFSFAVLARIRALPKGAMASAAVLPSVLTLVLAGTVASVALTSVMLFCPPVAEAIDRATGRIAVSDPLPEDAYIPCHVQDQLALRVAGKKKRSAVRPEHAAKGSRR
jgi:hypothetical protein